MQMATIGAASRLDEMPKIRANTPNPLVNTYQTATAAGSRSACCSRSLLGTVRRRPARHSPPIPGSPTGRNAPPRRRGDGGTRRDVRDEVASPSGSRPVCQRGQWDVVKKVSELLSDPQAAANGFPAVDTAKAGDPADPNPIQSTDATRLGPAPGFGGHTDEILLSARVGLGSIRRRSVRRGVLTTDAL